MTSDEIFKKIFRINLRVIKLRTDASVSLLLLIQSGRGSLMYECKKGARLGVTIRLFNYSNGVYVRILTFHCEVKRM